MTLIKFAQISEHPHNLQTSRFVKLGGDLWFVFVDSAKNLKLVRTTFGSSEFIFSMTLAEGVDRYAAPALLYLDGKFYTLFECLNPQTNLRELRLIVVQEGFTNKVILSDSVLATNNNFSIPRDWFIYEGGIQLLFGVFSEWLIEAHPELQAAHNSSALIQVNLATSPEYTLLETYSPDSSIVSIKLARDVDTVKHLAVACKNIKHTSSIHLFSLSSGSSWVALDAPLTLSDAIITDLAALTQDFGYHVFYSVSKTHRVPVSILLRGKTLLQGSGTPAQYERTLGCILGSTGNFYRDVDTGLLYGPKEESWLGLEGTLGWSYETPQIYYWGGGDTYLVSPDSLETPLNLNILSQEHAQAHLAFITNNESAHKYVIRDLNFGKKTEKEITTLWATERITSTTWTTSSGTARSTVTTWDTEISTITQWNTSASTTTVWATSRATSSSWLTQIDTQISTVTQWSTSLATSLSTTTFWVASMSTTTNWSTNRSTSISTTTTWQTRGVAPLIVNTSWNTFISTTTSWVTSWATAISTTTSWVTSGSTTTSWSTARSTTTTWATSQATNPVWSTSISTTTTWSTSASTTTTWATSILTSQSTTTVWQVSRSTTVSTSQSTTTVWTTTWVTSWDTSLSTTTTWSTGVPMSRSTSIMTALATTTSWTSYWNTSLSTTTTWITNG